MSRPTDSHLASAFRDLEDKICNARDAVLTAEMIFDDACMPGEMGKDAARLLGWGNYKILVLTPDQFDVIHHVMHRARDEADDLRKAYYAGFGERASE